MSDAAARTLWLSRDDLQRLVDALRAHGRRVLGPIVRECVLQFDEIRAIDELPVGWSDEQSPGRYRLLHSDDRHELFGVVSGPDCLKPHVFAPREPLLQIEMDAASGPGRPFRAEPIAPDAEPLAILGVRACDLAGLAVQDRVFLGDRFVDPNYAARRARLFLVAVGCTHSVSTCFCASMDTGPEPRPNSNYDIALTEIDDGFVARAGSDAGASLLESLALAAAPAAAIADERDAYAACTAGMQRTLPSESVRDLLLENLDHPRWDAVAGRCLSCANCTMVCPTCFCHDVRDEPSVDLTRSVRVREWDSCFNVEHARIHGLDFRPHIRERYRQWLVHKLATWVDQFGTSGCVGCGRCIAWCPVGIDLTEEVAAIAATDARS